MGIAFTTLSIRKGKSMAVLEYLSDPTLSIIVQKITAKTTSK